MIVLKRLVFVLCLLALSPGPSSLTADEVVPTPAASQTDPQAPSAPHTPEEIRSLIDRLNGDVLDDWKSASLALLEIGDAALPQLTAAQENADPKIASRAEEICLEIDLRRRLAEIDSPSARLRVRELIQGNPGWIVLVCRVRQEVDGNLVPVQDYSGTPLLTPLGAPGTDARGMLIGFLSRPVSYDGSEYHYWLVEAKTYESGGFFFEEGPNSATPDAYSFQQPFPKISTRDFQILPEITYRPAMAFRSPASGPVSIRANPPIEWTPYPGVHRTQIQLQAYGRGGPLVPQYIELDESHPPRIDLSRLIEAATRASSPVRTLEPGDRLQIQVIYGYGPDGVILSGSNGSLDLSLVE